MYQNGVIQGLQVGGSLGSVYVRDDVVAAITGCPAGNCIDTSGDGTADTQTDPHGSYLITAGPGQAPAGDQMSPWFTWGYWETAWNDGANEYHAHIPATMWIAGQRTADIDASYVTPSFTGTYDGGAVGAMIPSGGAIQDMGQGTSHLDIDFSATSTKVSGYIDFPNVVNMTIDGGNIVTENGHNVGFDAPITAVSSHTINGVGGGISGVFYGPQANAVGGSFVANDNVSYGLGYGTTYIGIFGANRSAASAAQ
jgi:hypothetical protein